MAEITRELREWANTFWGCGGKSHYAGDLLAIADRIDAEHERACAEAYGNGAMSVPIAVDESKWVKLPMDADGVPIRVGDVMECGNGTVFTVESIDLHTFGWRCGGDGIDANGYRCTAHPLPHSCHHHKPTVEGLLREFVTEFNRDDSELCDEEIIERFAAKLRLAGDAE